MLWMKVEMVLRRVGMLWRRFVMVWRRVGIWRPFRVGERSMMEEESRNTMKFLSSTQICHAHNTCVCVRACVSERMCISCTRAHTQDACMHTCSSSQYTVTPY